ncbi:unnamed protein product [Phytophthora fragariaefolia]|uniref:Unnamed protein product n=1 Tax=Phytophthora fragariaefolia TaxID=1490495 RepID=A0A9W6WX49_9STRA|nr:unnamed protein product [Phytophthora fragariaefolia]
MSFDWMLALAPCEHQSAISSETAPRDMDSPKLVERVATVEQMIAELQSASVEESQVTSPTLDEQLLVAVEPHFDDENDLVEEISESEEPATSLPDDDGNDYEMIASKVVAPEIGEVTPVLNEVAEATERGNSDLSKLASADGIEDSSLAPEDVIFETAAHADTKTLDQNITEGNDSGTDNSSCDAANVPFQGESIEDASSLRSWKVVVALVLILLIMYLVIDLMLHWVQHIVDYLGTQKQLVNVLLHDILLLLSGGSGSKLTDMYPNQGEDNPKRSVRGQSTTSPAREWGELNKYVHAEESSIICLPKLAKMDPITKSSPSPSFACVAMMLMAGHQAPISHENFSLKQNIFGQGPCMSDPTRDSIEVSITRKEVAALRIQKVWKASQHGSPSMQEHSGASQALAILDTKSHNRSQRSTPLFQLLQHRSKQTAHTPRNDKASAGLHRLLGELMDTLGIDTSPEEIDLMINEIDQDSNGEIDFDEFVAVMSRKVNATYTAEQVKNAFKAFEGNSSAPGFIKADKLLIALTTYGADRISPDQAQELISQVGNEKYFDTCAQFLMVIIVFGCMSSSSQISTVTSTILSMST